MARYPFKTNWAILAADKPHYRDRREKALLKVSYNNIIAEVRDKVKKFFDEAKELEVLFKLFLEEVIIL